MFKAEAHREDSLTETLSIKLTPSEVEMLTFIQQRSGMGPEQILEAFIGDLCCSRRSGGSDERMQAFAWFQRRGFVASVAPTDADRWRADLEE